MARLSPSTKLLCATAAGLGALLVAARVADDPADPDAIVQPVLRRPDAPPVPLAASMPMPTVAAAAAAGASTPASAPAPLAPALAERERTIPRSDGDAFGSLSWLPPPPPPPPAPPPPPPVVPAAPPPPTAPPLPFAFVGMVEQGTGKPQAFLSKGESLLVVAAGDLIENNTYRVDSLSASSVVLTYLPLGKQQTISVTGGSK